MEILFVLIPLSVVLVTFALWSFVWSVKNEQFDDLERQGWSILFDDKDPEEAANRNTRASSEQEEP